jgi:hypothetical protein
MSNTSLILSAVTIIALTGVTLTSLKYNSSRDDSNDELSSSNNNDIAYYDDNESNENSVHYHPKFRYDVNKNGSLLKRLYKRSCQYAIQYDIADKNPSAIDEQKRAKVKEVKIPIK